MAASSSGASDPRRGRYKYNIAPTSVEYDYDEDFVLREGAHRRHHQRARRSHTNRDLICICVVMFLGLLLYFGGGFLFISSYEGVYPFVKLPVDPPVLIGVYWYVGPAVFFVGLVIFILAFVWFCKRCHCACSER